MAPDREGFGESRSPPEAETIISSAARRNPARTDGFRRKASRRPGRTAHGGLWPGPVPQGSAIPLTRSSARIASCKHLSRERPAARRAIPLSWLRVFDHRSAPAAPRVGLVVGAAAALALGVEDVETPPDTSSVLAAPCCCLVPARPTAVDLVHADCFKGTTADAALLSIERMDQFWPRSGGEEADDVENERQQDDDEGGRGCGCGRDGRDDDRDGTGEQQGQAAGDHDPLAPCLGELTIVVGTRCGQPSTCRAERAAVVLVCHLRLPASTPASRARQGGRRRMFAGPWGGGARSALCRPMLHFSVALVSRKGGGR